MVVGEIREMHHWTIGFLRGLIHANQVISIRWRIGGAVFAAVILWSCGYYLTESANPLRQVGGVWARCCGPKHLRTVRESETNMATFHLSHAIRNTYSNDALKAGLTLPRSWPELIRGTGGYAGSHMAGTLNRAYPFLAKPVDPWGRPWIFRISVRRTPYDDLVDFEITFGSMGPDGRECLPVAVSGQDRRNTCDDLISTRSLILVPVSRIPPSVPIP